MASHAAPQVRTSIEVAADLFFMVHVALHRALSGHAHYDFHGRVPRALILGTGAAGALHLVLFVAR